MHTIIPILGFRFRDLATPYCKTKGTHIERATRLLGVSSRIRIPRNMTRALATESTLFDKQGERTIEGLRQAKFELSCHNLPQDATFAQYLSDQKIVMDTKPEKLSSKIANNLRVAAVKKIVDAIVLAQRTKSFLQTNFRMSC